MSANEKLVEYQHKALPARVIQIGLLLFIVGAVWSAAAFFADPLRAKFNYLVAFTFLASMAVGSLFWIAIEYIAGADWSTPIRRIPEFFGSLLWFVAIAAIPVILFSHDLYHWTHVETVASDTILAGKSGYLNEPFFIFRMFVVVGIWLAFYFFISRNSQNQDKSGDQKLTKINIRLSAAFILLFAFTITIAGIDWIMSLEPHFFSTMFGVYYFSGTVLAGISIITYATVKLNESGYLHPAMSNDTYYSLGALMFAFNIFWAYIAFSQYMLIWYANLPEETFWFIERMNNGWDMMALGLILFHFVIPFLVLLPRSVKTNPKTLKVMSIWLLLAHYYDLYFLIMPTYSPKAFIFGWMEIGFILVPFGLAIFVIGWQSRKKNLVPVRDPKLERGLHFHL